MSKQITTYEQLITQYQFGNPPKLLGEGGYGKVFLAFDKLRSRQVAIKVCEVKGDGNSYSLLAETEMVRQQIPPHPNIAYYSACYRLPMGLSQSDYAIIDYYPLGNLRQLWEKQTLSDATKGNLSEQILQGIHHLHTKANGGKGIIHRDLKPANILIADNPMDGNYIAKITDFGISKSLQSDSGHTSNSFAGGSLHYAAPEQLGGEEKISKNSDLWSWGVLTYQLFTGQLPYQLPDLGREETRAARFYAHLAQAGTTPLLHQLPEPYRTAVRQALTFNPQQRPQTAAALLQLISHYEQETIIEEPIKNTTIEEKTIVKPKPDALSPSPSKQAKPPTTNDKQTITVRQDFNSAIFITLAAIALYFFDSTLFFASLADIGVWLYLRKYLENFQATKAIIMTNRNIAMRVMIGLLSIITVALSSAYGFDEWKNTDNMDNMDTLTALIVVFAFLFAIVVFVFYIVVNIRLGVLLQKIKNDFVGLLKELGMSLTFLLPINLLIIGVGGVMENQAITILGRVLDCVPYAIMIMIFLRAKKLTTN